MKFHKVFLAFFFAVLYVYILGLLVFGQAKKASLVPSLASATKWACEVIEVRDNLGNFNGWATNATISSATDNIFRERFPFLDDQEGAVKYCASWSVKTFKAIAKARKGDDSKSLARAASPTPKEVGK